MPFTTCVGACTCCPCTSTSGQTVKTVGGQTSWPCSMLLHALTGKQHLCLPWCCRTPCRAPLSCCRRWEVPARLWGSAPLLQAAAGMLLPAQAQGLASWPGTCLLAFASPKASLVWRSWPVDRLNPCLGPGPACSDTGAMLLICQTPYSEQIAERHARSQNICLDPDTPCCTSAKVWDACLIRGSHAESTAGKATKYRYTVFFESVGLPTHFFSMYRSSAIRAEYLPFLAAS